MDTRRARTLRARAVLRARREGFLTPETRLEASLPVYYGAPQLFQPSHIRLTPSDGDTPVVITADMRVTMLPRIRDHPGCPHAIGAWVDVHVVSGEPLAVSEAVKSLHTARTVRMEAWSAVPGADQAWAHLTVAGIYDTTWPPGNVEVTSGGFAFVLLSGHTNAEWRLELRTDDPASAATETVQDLAARASVAS